MVEQVEGDVVIKQKRVRKPKIVEKVDGEANGDEVVKKKRVRKPKAVIEQGQGEEIVAKRGPVRPRKSKPETQEGSEPTEPQKKSRTRKPKPEKIPKKRGRPRKPRPELPEGVEPPPPKRRGRPRKIRPELPEGEQPQPKRRGRPRKQPTDAVVVRVPKKRGPRQNKEPLDPEAKKNYMRDYYHKRKSCIECDGCNQTFTYIASLKHHRETNSLCLMRRLGLLWNQLKEHEPLHATYLPFTTIIEQEFEHSAKIIGKGESLVGNDSRNHLV